MLKQASPQDQIVGEFLLVVRCISGETACSTLTRYLDQYLNQSLFFTSPITIPVLSQRDNCPVIIRVTSKKPGGGLICSAYDDTPEEDNLQRQCGESNPRCVSNLNVREDHQRQSGTFHIIQRPKRVSRPNISHLAHMSLDTLSHTYTAVLSQLVESNAECAPIVTGVSLAISQCQKGVHTLSIHCAYDERDITSPGLTVSIHQQN